ncbi:MAG: DUF4147 domain-containing protein [Pseudomonadota bacterium]
MSHHLRTQAQELFMAGVRAADPEAITQRNVEARLDQITGHRLTIIATGKASIPMMRGAMAALSGHDVQKAITVTNRENLTDLEGVMVLPAGHPVPDAQGAYAAQTIIDTVLALGAEDVLLFLVSGGTSAMLPAPAGDLTLDDEIAATQALLASGAPIDAVNAVRGRLSRVKSGGLSRMAGAATLITLMLSDVPGDDPAVIGSGPTMEPEGAAPDISSIMARYNLDTAFSGKVRAHVADARPAPVAEMGARDAAVICSNAISLRTVSEAAAALGYQVNVLSEWLDGDVEAAAHLFARQAQAADRSRPMALIAGGETTVQLVGDGKGGRNQELALRFALHSQELAGPWLFLSGGTDGRDGPTEAAGGHVDDTSVARIGDAAIRAALANNDAYHALAAGSDLLMTGGTGTNVADLQLLLLPPVSADI